MIYAQFKVLLQGLLIGDMQLPADDVLVKTMLEYALSKTAVDAEPLKLMTLNLAEPMIRLGPGDYIVRKPKIPLLDSDEIDIDDTLIFAVARLIASNLSATKGGIHKSIYNREVLDHNAIVYDVVSQMRQVHIELDLISDPEECGTADTEFTPTCSILLEDTNHRPVALPQSVTFDQNSVNNSIVLSGTDEDGDRLEYTITTQPIHGTLTGVGPNLIYTPTSEYAGADSFVFVVNDRKASSLEATVSISVIAVIDFIANVFNDTKTSRIDFIGEYIDVTVDDVTVRTVGDSTTLVSANLPTRSEVSIKGSQITQARFVGGLIRVHMERNSKQVQASLMFYQLLDLLSFTANPTTFGSVTNMNEAWRDCRSLESFPEIDTGNVTNMDNAWDLCSQLRTFPEIDTSSVTTMMEAWAYNTKLRTFPEIDTSSVTNMSWAWYNCYSLTSFPDIDTSSVTNMSYAWAASGLRTFPEIVTSRVTDMSFAWAYTAGLTSFPIIDISNVLDLRGAWVACTSLVCMEGLVNDGRNIPLPPNPGSILLHDPFEECTSLARPTPSEQSLILSGEEWINMDGCY